MAHPYLLDVRGLLRRDYHRQPWQPEETRHEGAIRHIGGYTRSLCSGLSDISEMGIPVERQGLLIAYSNATMLLAVLDDIEPNGSCSTDALRVAIDGMVQPFHATGANETYPKAYIACLDIFDTCNRPYLPDTKKAVRKAIAYLQNSLSGRLPGTHRALAPAL